ncbi:unnamed protein product [Closterium sp. NIES-64]|nr:unnamed protein product [Closterium sp. NIES-64]
MLPLSLSLCPPILFPTSPHPSPCFPPSLSLLPPIPLPASPHPPPSSPLPVPCFPPSPSLLPPIPLPASPYPLHSFPLSQARLPPIRISAPPPPLPPPFSALLPPIPLRASPHPLPCFPMSPYLLPLVPLPTSPPPVSFFPMSPSLLPHVPFPSSPCARSASMPSVAALSRGTSVARTSPCDARYYTSHHRQLLSVDGGCVDEWVRGPRTDHAAGASTGNPMPKDVHPISHWLLDEPCSTALQLERTTGNTVQHVLNPFTTA